MTESLLPPNATTLERGLEQASARIGELEVNIRALWRPDTCPIELLPWLAWALSLDNWSSDWPEHVKRARVRRALEIQRRKGTAESVRSVVESFGGAVALREWWQTEPPGEPHTFQLMLALSGVGGASATAAFTDSVIAEIHRTKPVRSHFTFTQGVNFAQPLGLVGRVRTLTFTRLQCLAAAGAVEFLQPLGLLGAVRPSIHARLQFTAPPA